MEDTMSTDTTPQHGRHIDHAARDEFELIAMTEPADAYGPAWRERFAQHHHLHDSIAS
jgi:hypothetical protein